ncbi:MAG: InlB B-repeat-containing protein [Fibrobacter sp.]|nr:InlB B-repeat-containing protein [Fibrobacter sp.]
MFTKFVREHGLTRLAVCLCVAQLASPNAFASPTTTKCFTDVMVVGGSDGDDLKTHYTSLGYTVIGQDLNEGAGGDYIYTVYPALEDGLSSCITDVIVRTEDYPAGFTFNGRKYHSTCGADYCSESFTSSECSLNSGTDGTKMWLYFTKEPFPDRRVVTDIAFTTGDVKVKEGYTTVGRNGAVVGTNGFGAVDLNEGASSGNNNVFMHVSVPPIYMHVSTSTTPVSADMPEYISDVVVFGGEDVSSLKTRYASQGWTVINKDLNADAGGDDVYMAYKKSRYDIDIRGNFISDFIIKTGDHPDQFTFEGRVYNRVPHYGSSHFESHGGNLNSKTKENSTNMWLYFTREPFPDNRVVTDIAFTTGKDNKTKEGYTTLGENGAVVGSDGSGAMDLNEGAGGDYIYMHFSTFNAYNTVTFVSGTKKIVIAPKLIYNGKKLDKPSDPVRPGFTFLGWFTTADGDALFDFKTPVTSDVSLYAQWRWDGGDLSNVDMDDDYVARDGFELTGTLASNSKISIADGATVTLKNVTINGVSDEKYGWAGLTCLGDCKIVLAEGCENSVKGFWEDYPGIYVPKGKTLTIEGSGSLDASSNGWGAGLCGGFNMDCGNVDIRSGIVIATGGKNSAGIGLGEARGKNTSCGNITIGGTKTKVTTTAGDGGPYSIGIGKVTEGGQSTVGTITIGGIETTDISESPFIYDKRNLLTHTDITVAAIDDQTYTGSEICPDVVVKDGETQLVAGVNYTVECTENISAGTANMTIIGKIGYAGSISKTFKIVPKEITIAWGEQTSFVYNGTEQAPTVKIEGLVSSDECTVTVSGAAKDVGTYTATATVECNDNYNPQTGYLEKNYEITMGLNLAKLEGYYTAQDGEVLTGKLSNNYWIEIANGATVTLYNVTINSRYLPGISCLGDCNIILAENSENTVEGSPGIEVREGYTLTISGTGSLDVRGKSAGTAGIGGGGDLEENVGNITISGGTITATGGEDAAGIGIGHVYGTVGNIAISGGTITATGGEDAAGIGGARSGSVGNITISGGTITATGGPDAPGIGAGSRGTVGNITISGGTITATGGEDAAGIGGGYRGTSGTVTINGGTITATGGEYAAGIGGGYRGTSGTVTINGGTITATGGEWAAGIGGGAEGVVDNITITDNVTKVTATKDEEAPYSIGKDRDGSRTGKITIGGIETSDISESPFVYPKTTDYAAVQIRGYNSGTRAVIDGEYSGTDAVNIPKDTAVASVVYNRKFLKNTYSTMVLPFSVKTDKVSGLNAVLYYNGIGKDANNNDAIRMKVLWAKDGVINDDKGNPVFYKDTVMKANTPYLVLMNSETFAVEGPVTIVPTADAVTKYDNLEWEFRGMWEFKRWDTGDRELGYAYGFAASSPENSKIKVGDFVKIGEGTHINPLRAYLVSSNIPETTTPTQGIRANGDYVKRPTVTQKELPELMSVIIDGLGDSDKGTTVIGQFNTRTGEFKMNYDRGKFDLKGRRVNGTNNARGAYYGKKTTARHPER